MVEILTASVQYNDWKGTAAADSADHASVQSYLKDKGYLGDEAFVVGFRVWFGANHGDVVTTISVRALVADGTGFDNVNAQVTSADVLRLKELNLELPIGEFFGLFKRFNLVLTSRDLGLDGRDYEITDEIAGPQS